MWHVTGDSLTFSRSKQTTVRWLTCGQGHGILPLNSPTKETNLDSETQEGWVSTVFSAGLETNAIPGIIKHVKK